jgi:hypothetical protein
MTNADPYVFYNLDRRTDIKPAGWSFENPLVSGHFTPRQANRWNAITGSVNFKAGDLLGKNMAAYWEVELDQISAKAITSYDVLMIHAPGLIRLSPDDREKLRIFIDAGGILWYDKATSQTLDGFNPLPVAFDVSSAGNNPYVAQPLHPILNYPYQIPYHEAAFLGSHRGRHSLLRYQLPGAAGLDDIAATGSADFDKFTPITANNNGMQIGIAAIGSGFFVACANNIVSLINEPAGTSGPFGRNSGPVGGTNFLDIPTTELKFVYNMIALSGGHSALNKGSRRLNSSFDDIGAPLLETWSDTALNLDQGDPSNYFPPVIYKGLVFVTAGNRLYAYKADTSRDLDGDGWNDDGYQDLSTGAPRDLVWQSTALQGPLSSPIAVEVSNGAPRDQVYIVDGQGRLLIFDALPKGPNGRLLGPNPMGPVATLAAPGAAPVLDTSQNNRGPYTPVYFDGFVYVVDAYQSSLGVINGRIWCVEASSLQVMTSGGTPWSCAGPSQPNLPDPGGSATVGYIPVADGSGGLDAVMYVSNRSSLSGAAAGVSSIWIGAKGEAPTVTRGGLSIDLVTRAASKGLRLYMAQNSQHGIHVYLVDDNQNGTPLDAITTATYLDGTAVQYAPGQLRLGLRQSLPQNIGVRIDYKLDWGTGQPNIVAQLLRTQLFLPDDINRQRYTVKSMALAPNGNLFIVTSNEFTNGTLFCVNEFSRGQFRLVYRWDLYDQIRITLNGTQTVNWGPALVDQDYLVTNMVPFLNQPLRRLHFHGSPTVINNICYLSASGEKATFGGPRVTIIMAFDANPTRTDVRLNGPVPAGFRMRQPDVAASTNKAAPERSVAMQADQVEINTESGVVRFNNMMSTTTGDMRNAFSSSLPVIVAGNGTPETLLDPDATGSKWSPLLWYFVINGYINESPPLVMGNTIYEAGGNILPSLFNGQFPPIPKASLFAMDADIPVNDPSILKIPNRPGLKQCRWLYPDTTPIGFRSNPHVKWPSGEGIQNFGDFLVRLNQSVLGKIPDNMALGCVGGDGTVVAWARSGIFGFKRANTVVADEGRVIETDSAGFVQWTSDMTYQLAPNGTGTLIQTQKLVRPTKVYKSSENEYVVVDTGGDRIVKLDKGAGELRSIDKISLDATYRPSGWQEGSELKLKQPRDVAFWSDYVPSTSNKFTSPGPVGQYEYWVHYLIADSGNRRLIEVVDRYQTRNDPTFGLLPGQVVRDGSGEPQVGKLLWHTPQAFSGKTWQYTAVQRFQIGIDNAGNAQFVYVTAVGDMMPTRVNTGLDLPAGGNPRETGGGAGGIVVFDGITTAGDQVVNQIQLPNGQIKPISGVSSVSVRAFGLAGGVVDYAVMFADSTGVYEIVRTGNNALWKVVWMMPNSAYENVRNVKLRAAAAKRMPNGDVLITNSFFGKTNPGPNRPAVDFDGEVTQWIGDAYDPSLTDFGFKTDSIRFELPPVVGSRGLRSPQFADRF